MNLKSFQEANWQKYVFISSLATGIIGLLILNFTLLSFGFFGMTMLFVLTLMEE